MMHYEEYAKRSVADIVANTTYDPPPSLLSYAELVFFPKCYHYRTWSAVHS